MWMCPKCHREFKRKNQNHFCTIKIITVDDYLNTVDVDKRPYLINLRNILINTVKGGKESIKRQMPIYSYDNISVSYYACQNFYALCVDEEVLSFFIDELKGYDINKGIIHLPYAVTDNILLEKIIRKSFGIR